MTVSKGEIWIANLNPAKKPNEMGKVRPVIVFQTDALNHNGYPTTIIIPLSTQLIDNAEPIRMRIPKREKLQHDSDAVITQIRSIDNNRFIERIATLTPGEMEKLKQFFNEIID